MKNRIALALAGSLALALAPQIAHAAACANGATNGYTTKLADGTTQCVVGLVQSDGRILQFSAPVDATQSPPVAVSPATADRQTTGNNTLASILSAQATAALQGTANTSLASILTAVQAGNTAQATAAAQATGNGSLATIASNTAGLATAAAQATLNAANGTPADPLYNGSNTATQIALLKAAVANLTTLISQAPPTLLSTATTPAGTQLPRVTLDPGPLPQPVVSTASEIHVGEVGGNSIVQPVSFVRPANTTAYAVGQIVANSTTAGSVVPLNFTVARKLGGTGRITRARLSSSNPAAVGVVFRLHLFKLAPTTTAGDGAAISGAVNGVTAVKIGQFDLTMDALAFSDGAKAIATPATGSYITFDANTGSQAIFGLIEARSAYTPLSGETFTAALEVDRD